MKNIACIIKKEVGEDCSKNREIDCQMLLHKRGEEGYIFLTIFGTTTNKMEECCKDLEKYDIRELPSDSPLSKLLQTAQNIIYLGDFDIKGDETLTIRFREMADVDEEVNDCRKDPSTNAVKFETKN